MRFQAGLLPLWLHAHPKSLWPSTSLSDKQGPTLCSKSGFVLWCSRNVGYWRLAGAVVEASHFFFSASQTDSACWPAFIFLFKTRIDECAFALKRSWKCYFNKLVPGNREGGDSGETKLVVTMLLILTLDVKLQMLIINKIYIQS